MPTASIEKKTMKPFAGLFWSCGYSDEHRSLPWLALLQVKVSVIFVALWMTCWHGRGYCYGRSLWLRMLGSHAFGCRVTACFPSFLFGSYVSAVCFILCQGLNSKFADWKGWSFFTRHFSRPRNHAQMYHALWQLGFAVTIQVFFTCFTMFSK